MTSMEKVVLYIYWVKININCTYHQLGLDMESELEERLADG